MKFLEADPVHNKMKNRTYYFCKVSGSGYRRMDFLLYFVYKGLGKGHEGTVLTWAIYGFGFTLPAGH